MPIRPEMRDKYPPREEWRRLRAAVLARAGECCEFCRIPNGSKRGGTRIVLTTAHLDHDSTHNDLSNLRALCQACHLAYDREHHRETRQDRKDGERPLLTLERRAES